MEIQIISMNIPGYYLYPPMDKITCCATLLSATLDDFHHTKLYYNVGEKSTGPAIKILRGDTLSRLKFNSSKSFW